MSGKQTLITAFYGAYNAHDHAAAGELYTDEGVHEDIAGGKLRQGRTAVEAGLKGFFAMLPDVVFDIENTVVSRDAAVVFYRMRGHIGYDFGTMQTKGKPIDLPGVHVFAFDGEKIKATTDFWNEADFRTQLQA